MYSVIASDGQVYGPVDIPTLLQWCGEGRVQAGTNLVDPLSGRVFRAQDLDELASVFTPPSAAPPVSANLSPPTSHVSGPQGHVPIQIINQVGPQHYPATYSGFAPKQRIVAGLLALFLGALGVHRFYLGKNGSGVAMLLITVLTCGYGAIVTGIWALIDAVMCFTGSMTDSDNRPLV